MSDHLFPNYVRAPIKFVKGRGSYLFDEAEQAYLDFSSGIAVNSLGHCDSELVKTVKEQAETLWHTSNLFRSPMQEATARILCENTFGERVIFCNSGAEAMEISIKTARRYSYDQGKPDQFHIITFEGAFHGRTIATIAAGGQQKYYEGFGPKAPGFTCLPMGDVKALENAMHDNVAGILIEPLQGEGGVYEVPLGFMQLLRETCDTWNVPLIFDEVQCGAGRTGYLFAHQKFGVEPDIMGIAKGMGGGFPVGACVAREKFANVMQPGTHGTTYGGNPLAMAVAHNVLSRLSEPAFLAGVRQRGNALRQSLQGLADRFPHVIESVQGEGLMLGLRCVPAVGDIVTALRDDHHMLVVASGKNTLRLLPPLTISDGELRRAVDKLEAMAAQWETSDKSEVL